MEFAVVCYGLLVWIAEGAMMTMAKAKVADDDRSQLASFSGSHHDRRLRHINDGDDAIGIHSVHAR